MITVKQLLLFILKFQIDFFKPFKTKFYEEFLSMPFTKSNLEGIIDVIFEGNFRQIYKLFLMKYVQSYEQYYLLYEELQKSQTFL